MKITHAALRGFSGILIAAAALAGCGPSPSGLIRVEIVPPQAARELNLAKEFFGQVTSTTPCSLPVSRITATSATQGTTYTELAATVIPSAVSSAASGDSVLSFSGTASLTLSPAADWFISYIGVFGSANCLGKTVGGTLLSVGRTGPLSLTQDGATVPITITTRASAPMASSTNSFLDGTNNELIRFPNAISPSPCSSAGTVDVLLADGTLLNRAAIAYSIGVGRTVTTGDLIISPVPADTGLIFQISKTDGTPKTFTIPIQTGHATDSSSEVMVTTETGFCTNNLSE